MKMLGKRVIQLCLHSILILHRNSLITSKSKKRDLVFFKGGMSLKFECLPRLYEQSHWKKDTTAVLFKDENLL